MAKVLNQVKILPEDIEVDLKKLAEDIRQSLPKDMSLYKTREEPIAFGLSALKVFIITEDVEDAVERLENTLKGVKGVSEIQIEMSSLVNF